MRSVLSSAATILRTHTPEQGERMLITQLLLVGATASTVLATAPRFDCDCHLSKNNYYLYKVGCSVISKNEQQQEDSSRPNLSCSHEVKSYVPPGYEYRTARFLYKLYRTSVKYEQAVKLCEQDGATLAVPTSRAEAQAIGRILLQYAAITEAFIGINDIKEEGNFVSISGTPIASLGFEDWVPGQPDNWSTDKVTGEDCVTINKIGLYNDYRCDWAQAFVCQRRVAPVPPSGYRFVPQMGFYKHYASQETYAASRQRCLDDGGHLAVIETVPEAEELITFFDVNENVHEAYIGLNDIEKEGEFVTETGKPLSSLSFANWGNTEPNNDDAAGENCVIFRKDGSINDVNCARLFSYICEIPLPAK